MMSATESRTRGNAMKKEKKKGRNEKKWKKKDAF
jgi:hypothetical protein